MARVPPDSTLPPAVEVPIKATDGEVDRVPIPVSHSPAESVALVIGIEEYDGSLPRADFAASDAVRIQEYLTGLLGFHEDQVLTLLNRKATRIEVAQAVERWLPQRVHRDGTVFVYFAGLGTAHPKSRDAYLLPADGLPSTLTRSGYPLKRLYQQLAALPAKHVFVMLDACFGGMGDRSVPTGRKLVPGVELSDASVNQGKIVVLAAGRGAQGCHAYREQRHGLLTYFFLKGLRGPGDRDNDGKIRLSEQFDYVRAQVQSVARRVFHAEQVPQLLGRRASLARWIDLLPRVRH